MAEEHRELFSQNVTAGGRTYFIDVKESKEGPRYLVISESHYSGGRYELERVMIFEEYLQAFANALDATLVYLGVRTRAANKTGQLLLASIFPSQLKRPTEQTAHERNRFVAALSEKLLVIHAEPDSRLVQLCQEVLNWGKPVYSLDDPTNAHLAGLGVKLVSTKDFAGLNLP